MTTMQAYQDTVKAIREHPMGHATAHEHIVEAIIDTNGLDMLLDAIATVCAEKGEHLLTEWQSKSEAKAWDRAANRIQALSAHDAIRHVSPECY